MNRPVCHACVGLPRAMFCNVCDNKPTPQPAVKLTSELRAIGQIAYMRSREDGCASSFILCEVYFNAIHEHLQNEAEDSV